MRCGEIIAVGSELLLGGRLDTNSLFLTERLGPVGVEVRFKSVVGDVEDDIVAAIRTAARRADVVVLTGGLGPTVDDRTRQAVARATGCPLSRRPEALEGMRRRLATWGRPPTAAQLRQALIPKGAEVLANPVGSAPGFRLSWKSCLIVALPGVPAEAEQMFFLAVAPELAAESAAHERIERRVLHTFGLPESDLDGKLQGVVRAGRGVRLGLLASPLGVTVTLTACGAHPGTPKAPKAGRNARESVLDRLTRIVRRRIGRYVYAEGAETMEEVVGRYLADQGLRLAVAESCTGGLIGHRLTQVPGSSTYLDRVAVCYSNQAKIELLGVPEDLMRQHGAVSAEVAAAMARGIRIRSHAGVGLSVTGIAGPGGGTVMKPVGLVYVGLDTGENDRSVTREFRFHGDRQAIKMRASQAALEMLRRWLVRTGARVRS
ncbi:MAG: competence/damage-inducible protein A [Nitrospirae bacterium]|nr:competence/damage-inducible protein A [Nitrospirota bacterium]